MRNAAVHLDGARSPIYDDEDYFLALRDFLEGGGPVFSSEADAAGAEEEDALAVESSLAAGFSTWNVKT